MSELLSVTNKLLSIRGRILLTDENDNLAFEARGELALFSPTWTIFQIETPVATIRRRLFALRQTWEVTGRLGDFLVKRKIFSITRKMYVVGGPYDGAKIGGNIWDLRFSIEKGGTPLAKAAGKILTLRDRHNVQLLSQSEPDILFTVISMVIVQLDRKHEESEERE